MYRLFCVVLCIDCVYMCTELLPPGGYPIAVNKYIISIQVTTKVHWAENTFIATSVPDTRRCVQTHSAADPCTSSGKANHCCRLQPVVVQILTII